jgi:alginate O-acetyltransferase complex protein AlgI
LSWTTPLLALCAVAWFWRLGDKESRARFLYAATLALTFYLSWQYLPDFGILRLRTSTGLRMLGGAAILAANLALVAFTVRIANGIKAGNRALSRVGLSVLIGLFILAKWTALQQLLIQILHLPGKSASLAGAWLGLSYILFRLIHILLEAGKGKLPELSFSATATYALFPATLLSGPIDRFPRFQTDVEKSTGSANFTLFGEAAWRILRGLIKKFVFAEYLMALPIDPATYPSNTPVWQIWILLYTYGFVLYFDFSGYTDIAIGMGRLIGFSLPENFDSPYAKQNLARFWQSWHMTLSFWLRDYVFLPLGKQIRQKTPWIPLDWAVLICHLATMILIGLWHAFSWNFVLFGVWHAVGLWVVKLWGDYCKTHPQQFSFAKDLPRLKVAASTTLTFHYVMLGWIFFSARDLSTAIWTFGRAFGLAS